MNNKTKLRVPHFVNATTSEFRTNATANNLKYYPKVQYEFDIKKFSVASYFWK